MDNTVATSNRSQERNYSNSSLFPSTERVTSTICIDKLMSNSLSTCAGVSHIFHYENLFRPKIFFANISFEIATPSCVCTFVIFYHSAAMRRKLAYVILDETFIINKNLHDLQYISYKIYYKIFMILTVVTFLRLSKSNVVSAYYHFRTKGPSACLRS